jgi:sulfoxide reductase heme-binding subunit YedZ
MKALALVLCALPAAGLIARYDDPVFIANPMPEVIRSSGLWSLRLLLIVLAVGALAHLPSLAQLGRLRRTLGLAAAAYAGLHLVAWARYYAFDWRFLLDESLARAYLTVGLFAALLLLGLALTSNDFAKRWLGTTAWQRLHVLAYTASLLTFVHYAMAKRFDRRELTAYGAVLLALSIWRAVRLRAKSISSIPPAR